MDVPCPTCELHAPKAPSRCEAWGGSQFDLLRLVRADRPARCPFTEHVLTPLAAAVARRSAGLVDKDDLLGEVMEVVLRRFAKSPELAPSELGQLRRLLRTTLVDVLRKDTGRRRCTACGHYRRTGEAGGTCQRQYGPDRQPHPHHGQKLEARSEPQRLRPPCHGFVGAAAVAVDPELADSLPDPRQAGRTDDMRDALHEALRRLTVENERAGLFVMRNKLDGLTYEQIAAEHGLSRDQVKRVIQHGMERLRDLLGGAG